MEVFTVCTRDGGWFRALQASCERHGYTLTVLGWGAQWRGFAWRLRLMRAALRQRDPDALIVFVDAYDVVFLEDAETLRARYRALADDGRRILFGVEGHLQPQFAPSKIIARALFGSCLPSGDVVNCGVYLGPAVLVRRMLRLLLGLCARGDADDDQKALNRVCHHPSTAAFFARHVAYDRAGLAVFHAACQRHNVGLSCDTFGLRTPDLVNPRTGHRPCVLHAPGGIDLNGICRLASLPLGARPRAQHLWWDLTNFWRETVVFVALLVAVTVALRVSFRRPAVKAVHGTGHSDTDTTARRGGPPFVFVLKELG